jgi:ERCC4-type nuclease
MPVILDSIEPSHIKDLFHEFYPSGTIERLDSADLACTEYNVGIERKTNQDFVGSVIGTRDEPGRIKDQARRMSETYNSSYIILVGGYADLPSQDKQRFTKAMWEGAIISLMARYNMKFLKVNTNREFFEISKRIFSKSDGVDKHSLSLKKATKNDKAVVVGCLYQIPNVGIKQASAIVDELNITHARELSQYTKEDYMKVKGVGELLASRIKEEF